MLGAKNMVALAESPQPEEVSWVPAGTAQTGKVWALACHRLPTPPPCPPAGAMLRTQGTHPHSSPCG